MNMQGALRARLLAAPDVTARVGRRVDWVNRPQAADLPAITLQVVSEDRPQHMRGFDGLRTTRVQIDIFAKTYAETKQIAEAVFETVITAGTFSGITFERSFFDGSRDLGERTETLFIHRTSMDFLINHQA